MTDPDQTPTLAATDSQPLDPTLPVTASAPAHAGDDSDAAPAVGDHGADPAVPTTVPGAGVRYAVLRLLMLVTVGGVLYLIGMRGWALLFAAVLVSAIASFFVFMRQREAAARNLEAKAAARAARRHPQAPSTAGTDA
jgi:hypothetical protein